MNLLRHIPNTLTSGNLLCGCLGLVSILNNLPVEPAYFIWAACVFDFLDGFAARWLKVSSPIGKELDSLADMVSFGVLPAITMFRWIDGSAEVGWIAYSALLIAVFSALRLAKFNVDTRQTDSFIGVPTPANALLLSSLIFLPDSIRSTLFNANVLAAIALVTSLLLVSPIELFALKFKDFSLKNNKVRFGFTGLAIILLFILKAGALPVVILSYIVISLGNNLLVSKNA